MKQHDKHTENALVDIGLTGKKLLKKMICPKVDNRKSHHKKLMTT